jgi:hypothetical protein|tara:strand:- start:2061 stop:2240 length:180 start_codon:yes stop_codon:yes gene_type:complete
MDYMNIPPIAHRIQNSTKIETLEKQIEYLLDQQKNILEYLVEMGAETKDADKEKYNKQQ